MLAIRLDAPNDNNGNPRRVWVVIDSKTGDIIDTIDEEYMGIGPLRQKYPDAVEGPRFATTPHEYRAMKE